MADNKKDQQWNKQSKDSKDQKQPQANKPKGSDFVREQGRGIVKAVPSGDTIIVLHMDKAHQGLPIERQITISSIQAPFLRRRGGNADKDKKNQQDEAFAWASRDYLRKKVVGKQVQYTIDFKNPSGREYGVVKLLSTTGAEPENVVTSVVSNGWAKVKRPTTPGKDGFRPELQELIDLEEQAQKAGKGIWSKEPEDIEQSKRPNNTEVNNPASLFEQLKGKAQVGVVELVRTGSSLKVVLLPSFSEVNLFLSGVQCPEFKQDGEFEPFGREAKFFTEHHILNRDVNIILEGVDKYNVYGTVSYLNHNLSEELLKNGLAKYVEWSGSRSAFSENLKAAEKSAKEKKMRIWANFTEAKPVSGAKDQDDKKGAKPGKEIFGKVVEVLPGGVITVIDAGGNDHKINLSSVRIPRLIKEKEEKKSEAPATTDNKKKEKKVTKESVERAYAWEAKEFLRRRLIGQKVKCIFDYTRASVPMQNPKKPQQPAQQDAPDRAFYSVHLDKNNVAVELVEQGFAWAQEHRGGELRSKDYEHILLAEERAKKLNRGLYGPEEKAPVLHINDVSLMDVSKARQYLPFLKRAGRQRGVVEYEFSATKLKIFVPKESAQIAISLAAVRAPQRNEPFSKEALTFTRDICHQHDVEFEVLAQDRGGSFIGNVWVNKKNLATSLLEQGFAEVHRGSVKDSDHSTEYIIAEDSAKRSKKNMWKNYDEAVEQEARKQRRQDSENQAKPKQESHDIVITEVIDGCKFFYQTVGPEAEQLDELMKNLAVETSDVAHAPKLGELVKAQFVDDAWYRAKVRKVTPEGFEVLYIDYGNSEVLPASRIRTLDASFAELPPQAREAQLAYIKAPELNEEYGTDAALFLRDLVGGKSMMANLEYRDADHLFMSLIDRDSQVFVNAALLRAGLARVERVRGKHVQPLIEKLKEEEDKARSAHLYLWEYGDPGFDDEEERGVDKKPKAKGKEEKK